MFYSDREKRRNQLRKQLSIAAVLTTLLLLSGAMSDGGFDLNREDVIKPDNQYRSDIVEISGMTIIEEQGQELLVSVGDKNSNIQIHTFEGDRLVYERVISLKSAFNAEFSFCNTQNSLDCKAQEKEINAQWEGIAADQNHFFLLKEFPSSIVVVDRKGEKVSSLIRLDYNVDKIDTKKKHKKRDNSLGEGLILLNNGHILVARENTPPSIIEFGPRGAEAKGFDGQLILNSEFPLNSNRMDYVALKSWKTELNDTCDLSELTLAPNGKIRVLSQTCNQVIELGELSLKATKAKTMKSFQLSNIVEKPEAMAIRANGQTIIGSDTKHQARSIFTFNLDTIDAEMKNKYALSE